MSKKSKIFENLEMSEKRSFSEHTPKSSISDDSKNFRSNVKKERFVRICPKCGSVDITRLVLRILGPLICKNCNYKNPIFPEIEINKIELFRKELENLNKFSLVDKDKLYQQLKK